MKFTAYLWRNGGEFVFQSWSIVGQFPRLKGLVVDYSGQVLQTGLAEKEYPCIRIWDIILYYWIGWGI